MARRWRSGVLRRPPTSLTRRLHSKQPWPKRSPAVALPLSAVALPLATKRWEKLTPVDPVVTDIVDVAMSRNTIMRVNGNALLDETIIKIIIRFTKLCLDVAVCCPRAPSANSKAVVITQSVPTARKYFDEARKYFGDKALLAIATMAVDCWGRTEWQEAVRGKGVLIITPCLFHDAIKAGHLEVHDFCSLVFVECKGVVGSGPHSNPMSRIPGFFSTVQPRILGLATAKLTPSQVTVLKQRLAASVLEIA